MPVLMEAIPKVRTETLRFWIIFRIPRDPKKLFLEF